jgi:hypothetical protein
MRKVRSNALWNELSPKNKEVLDTWLFENNLSYAKIYPRARRELRFKGSLASLKRYGKRRKHERLLEKLKEWGRDTAQVGKTGAGPDQLRIANMRVLNGYLFEALRDDPKAMKELGPVVKAMLQNDYTETIRELRSRELQIREAALAFTKEKFEFDMMERALRALPQLRELAEARKDPQTKKAEQSERFKQLRRMMFGDEEDEEKLQAPGSQAPEKLQDPNDESSMHE